MIAFFRHKATRFVFTIEWWHSTGPFVMYYWWPRDCESGAHPSETFAEALAQGFECCERLAKDLEKSKGGLKDDSLRQHRGLSTQ